MNEFVTAARRSRRFHRPWGAAPDTPAKFRAYLARTQRPTHRGFLVCRRDDGAIAGAINISEIVRGSFRSAYLGYYVFKGFERQGYMTEGLRAAVRHGFRVLRLHRLEANIQPRNAASLALAKRCGFRREGLSPRYLKIGGRWKDHERWAILSS